MSESSFDGSIASDSVDRAIWASTTTHGEEMSPIQRLEHMDQLGEQFLSDDEGDVQRTLNFQANDEEYSYVDGEPSSYPLDSSPPPQVLSSCHKLSAYLQQRGFDISDLEDDDVNPINDALPVSLLDHWASTVLHAVVELCDRVDAQRLTVSSASLAVKNTSASKEALESRIADLQALVMDLERKDRASQAKLAEFDRSKLVESKSERSVEAEHRKKVKNLEGQVQEALRKLRAKEIEYDRLRDKLVQLTNKEREAAGRNKDMLQRILSSGDYSLLAQDPQPSPTPSTSAKKKAALNTSTSSASSRGKTNEDVQKVFEVLDGHRRELLARNKELELQVEDLLQTIAMNHNSSLEQSRLSDSKEDVRADVKQMTAGGGDKGTPKKSNKQLLAAYPHTPEPKDDGRFMTILKEDYHDLYFRLANQEDELTACRHGLIVARAEYEEIYKTNSSLRISLQEAKEQLNTMQYELDARPSVKEFKHLKYNLDECEAKLSQYVLYSGQQKDVQKNYKKYLPTSEAVRIDKLNHNLQLYLLDHLSKDILLESMKDICRELGVNDVTFALPCIAKLKKAVCTIPVMEKYIIHINSYLLDRNEVLNEKLGLRAVRKSDQVEDSMEAVKAILPRWWSLVQQSVDLARFRETVLVELFRSQMILGGKKADDDQVQSMWRTEGRALWQIKDPRAIASILRELVDLQAEVLSYSAGRVDIMSYIQTRPDLILNRIIRHILYIFDIQNVDGVVPRLNAVYLQQEEMETFLKGIKQALRKETASNAMVFADLVHIVSKHCSQL